MFSANELVKLDQEVINKYHKKLISNFNKRGWAIYNTLNEDISFLSERDIKKCVLRGSEKESIEAGVLYVLLPYIEDDSDWKEIKKVMTNCVVNKRYPFFVDLGVYADEGVDCVESIGVYLIDAILFDSKTNTFELVIDYDLMTFLGIEQKRKGNIELELIHVGKILKQVTKATRDESSN